MLNLKKMRMETKGLSGEQIVKVVTKLTPEQLKGLLKQVTKEEKQRLTNG